MRERDFMVPGRSVALAANAMAATSHPAATLAALDILRAGGNAIDAAIAAAALQGVVDPHMTGVGGDVFALYAPAGGPLVAFNGSGRAPAAAHPDRFAGMDAIPDASPHAVTVPGAVDAWCTLADRYGRIGLDRILAPAIAAAEGGFTITPRVALDWARYAGRVAAHPSSAALFLPGGRAPVTGERIANPALGATLRRIAAEGRAAFYEGAVADEIVAVLKALGGLHEAGDFAAYRGLETAPISAPYRGHRLNECPPNGQGIAALLIARILEGFDLGEGALGEADRIHLLAEATKLAYRERDAILADPDAMTVSVDDVLADTAIEAMRGRIAMDRAGEPAALDIPDHRDTVFISVVDAGGNAVSFINSVFHAFGSGITAPRAGVLLHNRGAGFVLTPGHPNAIGPGKRPFHTIIPAMLTEDGLPVMSFGVMGGQYQAVGHAAIMTGVVDRGFDVQMASDQPRSFFTEGALTLEPTVGMEVRAELARRGHTLKIADEPLGACQAIMIDRARGVLWGASDHRKDGVALGY